MAKFDGTSWRRTGHVISTDPRDGVSDANGVFNDQPLALLTIALKANPSGKMIMAKASGASAAETRCNQTDWRHQEDRSLFRCAFYYEADLESYQSNWVTSRLHCRLLSDDMLICYGVNSISGVNRYGRRVRADFKSVTAYSRVR